MNTRNDTELHNAKVGDRIYSMVHDQFLTVNHIVRAMSGKWYIEFEGGAWCTPNGCHYNDKGVQTYFWDKPQVVAPVKPVIVPKNDVLVGVRQTNESSWVKRYSTGHMINGKLQCWGCGRTSLTASDENDYSCWDVWRECKV